MPAAIAALLGVVIWARLVRAADLGRCPQVTWLLADLGLRSPCCGARLYRPEGWGRRRRDCGKCDGRVR